MSAAAPDPSRLALLAVIGIGVYWFATRRAAVAGTVPVPAGQGVANPYRAQQDAANASMIGAGLNALGKLFSNGIAAGTYDGRSAQSWNTSPTYGQPGVGYNNPSAYIASSGVDGLPFNPVSAAPFDTLAYGMDGSNGAWWN